MHRFGQRIRQNITKPRNQMLSNRVWQYKKRATLGIWYGFEENGVNITFPQGDIRIIKGDLS